MRLYKKISSDELSFLQKTKTSNIKIESVDIQYLCKLKIDVTMKSVASLRYPILEYLFHHIVQGSIIKYEDEYWIMSQYNHGRTSAYEYYLIDTIQGFDHLVEDKIIKVGYV